MSIHVALETALPKGSIAPKRFDVSSFCDFTDFDRLRPEARALIATNETEVQSLHNYGLVSGHFCLPTLLRLAPSSAIATVVREPRSRILSLYAYWRVTDLTVWHPYDVHRYAQGTLETFLAEPTIAPVIDNQLCRLLLDGDPRFPRKRFMEPTDAKGLAESAIEKINTLGLAAVHQLSEVTWADLSEFFATILSRRSINVTGKFDGRVLSPRGPHLINAEVLELLDYRTAADCIVYHHVATRVSGDPDVATRLANTAFARQLVQLGTNVAF